MFTHNQSKNVIFPPFKAKFQFPLTLFSHKMKIIMQNKITCSFSVLVILNTICFWFRWQFEITVSWPIVVMSVIQPIGKNLIWFNSNNVLDNKLFIQCTLVQNEIVSFRKPKCQNWCKVLKTDFSDLFVIWCNNNDCVQGQKFWNYKSAMLKT